MVLGCRASSALTPDPVGPQRLRLVNLKQPLTNGVLRQPARSRCRSDPAIPKGASLTGREPAPLTLIQLSSHQPVALRDRRLCITHDPLVLHPHQKTCT